ncbi:MAG: hypothetical protein Tsb009_30660 [Planctomycetaceae bacterium]
MEVWQLILYGGASVVALRLLVALIQNHRRTTLKKLLDEQFPSEGDGADSAGKPSSETNATDANQAA